MIWCYIKPVLEAMGVLGGVALFLAVFAGVISWLTISHDDMYQLCEWYERLWMRLSAAVTAGLGLYLLWPLYIARVHELCR